MVYASSVENLDDLPNWIIAMCNSIRNDSGFIQVEGRHFIHLLHEYCRCHKDRSPYISETKNISKINTGQNILRVG